MCIRDRLYSRKTRNPNLFFIKYHLKTDKNEKKVQLPFMKRSHPLCPEESSCTQIVKHFKFGRKQRQKLYSILEKNQFQSNCLSILTAATAAALTYLPVSFRNYALLASAALACPSSPSPRAILATRGAIAFDAASVMDWWVQVFKKVPTQTLSLIHI